MHFRVKVMELDSIQVGQGFVGLARIAKNTGVAQHDFQITFI